MKVTKFKLIKIALLGLLLMPIAALGNWGASVTGVHSTGNLKAYGADHVELLDEDLQIEFRQSFALVKIKYLFHNCGKDVVVSAGFPSRVFELEEQPDLEAYEIKANNVPVAFERREGKASEAQPLDKGYAQYLVPDYDESEIYIDQDIRVDWLVSKVPFKADEKKEIVIGYRAHYLAAGGGWSDDDDSIAPEFHYLLSTGSAWKGAIRKGRIVMRSVGIDPDAISIKPKGRFKRDGSIFTWEFENLKPAIADDIKVTIGSPTAIRTDSRPDGVLVYHYVGKSYFYLVHKPSGIIASSTNSDGTDKYSAKNLVDDKLDTAWVPEKAGGIGESVTMKFKKATQINQFAIYPGYGKSWDLYQANNRVAQISVFINGEHNQVFDLPDIPGKTHLLSVTGYNKPVASAKFTILKVYKGTKYDDTAMSEIQARQVFKKKPEILRPPG